MSVINAKGGQEEFQRCAALHRVEASYRDARSVNVKQKIDENATAVQFSVAYDYRPLSRHYGGFAVRRRYLFGYSARMLNALPINMNDMPGARRLEMNISI